jgi:hypothetical protein
MADTYQERSSSSSISTLFSVYSKLEYHVLSWAAAAAAAAQNLQYIPNWNISF